MRLSYILLAATATLLASGNIASAATALSNTQISEVATADLVQSINTGARRLRSARFADVDGDSDDDNDDDDREEVADREERANFSKSQISKMLDDTAYMNKKFKNGVGSMDPTAANGDGEQGREAAGGDEGDASSESEVVADLVTAPEVAAVAMGGTQAPEPTNARAPSGTWGHPGEG
ncbi:hypothetical protein PF003_g29572 [Phytophthora fragariae]|nr:hypothetical protein PF003_g29572 [Phytophthora fragariae]